MGYSTKIQGGDDLDEPRELTQFQHAPQGLKSRRALAFVHYFGYIDALMHGKVQPRPLLEDASADVPEQSISITLIARLALHLSDVNLIIQIIGLCPRSWGTQI